jgi:hypothetical protein
MRILYAVALLFGALPLMSWAGAQHYPSVEIQNRVFEVPDVKHANVSFDIKSSKARLFTGCNATPPIPAATTPISLTAVILSAGSAL